MSQKSSRKISKSSSFKAALPSKFVASQEFSQLTVLNGLLQCIFYKHQQICTSHIGLAALAFEVQSSLAMIRHSSPVPPFKKLLIQLGGFALKFLTQRVAGELAYVRVEIHTHVLFQ